MPLSMCFVFGGEGRDALRPLVYSRLVCMCVRYDLRSGGADALVGGSQLQSFGAASSAATAAGWELTLMAASHWHPFVRRMSSRTAGMEVCVCVHTCCVPAQ